ncbi:mucin-2-like [Mobula hypostoma]|uniref:mucin-2-like n=1 Tax=Mobula hypostoma TaxID=723540 RepID=UPI002FC3B5AF
MAWSTPTPTGTTVSTTSSSTGTTPTTSTSTGPTVSTTSGPTSSTPGTTVSTTTSTTGSTPTPTGTTVSTTSSTTGTTPTTSTSTGPTVSTTSGPTSSTPGTTVSTTTSTTGSTPTPTGTTVSTTSSTTGTTPTISTSTGPTVSTTLGPTSSTTGTTVSTTTSTTEITGTTTTTGPTVSTTSGSTPTPTGTTVFTTSSTTGTTPTTSTSTSTGPTVSTTSGPTSSTTGTTVSTTTSTTGTTTTTTGTTESTTSFTTETTPTTSTSTGTTVSTTSGTTSSTTGTTVSTTISTRETTPTTTTTETTVRTTSGTTSTTGTTVSTTTPTTETTPTTSTTGTTVSTTSGITSSTTGTTVSTTGSTTGTTPSMTGTTKSTTGSTTVITTLPTPTEPECFCDAYPERKCNETWRVNCSIFTCIKEDTYTIEHIACQRPQKPKCSNGLQPVKIHTEDGCCVNWDCEYICHTWGQEHYQTFEGVAYKFFENCSYVLVEEVDGKYGFSVIIDNYYCRTSKPYSCGKTLIIKYNGNTLHVNTKREVESSIYFLQEMLNGEALRLPHNAKGFSISKQGSRVNIDIPDIRTTIIVKKNYTSIKVSEELFLYKLRGQCGTVSKYKSDECMRRNGKVEPNYCCSETAYEWKVSSRNGQHCTDVPTNKPCIPTTAPPPPCEYGAEVCDVITEESFSTCRSHDSLSSYVDACRYDNCKKNKTDCSSLEAAAMRCNAVGSCVDWRQSTNGLCNYICPPGFVYKACANFNHNYCRDNKMVTGKEFNKPVEGCFCPEGTMLSEDWRRCVSSCTGTCKDSSGNIRNDGEEWSESNNTCEYYRCSNGTIIKMKISCSYPKCDESEKKWDRRHCCYDCFPKLHPCKVQPKTLTINKNNCTATVELNSCEGNCNSYSMFDYTLNNMKHKCECCREQTIEEKEVTLDCNDGSTKPYSYISAKTCRCSICEDSTN